MIFESLKLALEKFGFTDPPCISHMHHCMESALAAVQSVAATELNFFLQVAGRTMQWVPSYLEVDT
jgi:NADH:ubiquinone oxidoreductase subunit E